ncbi:hypothetical protein Acav_4450 [Paracidovorax avenae ATCC 19860]|uniref:Uncharacterized protein n=1 Tax=Paracidovorax avenae (strain ATCC 19860 / DSM 7227 / CCUG 15838 / JCM 20985 / LMG 2117 / NCPPB 1011) TaxID=643561 RepID=F0Q8M0_PARA1|nr:hypothetical protein Acav_4450 [Paracidovorax avenae ATCC 19860]
MAIPLQMEFDSKTVGRCNKSAHEGFPECAYEGVDLES